MALFVTHTNEYRYASIFLSVIEKIVIFCGNFYSQLQRAVEPEKKVHSTRLLQENLARPAANQNASAIICSHIVRIINP